MNDTERAEADLAAVNHPTLGIEVDHPEQPGTLAWTLLWDGRTANVQALPGVDVGDVDDWGIPYASPDYTDAWLAQGGTACVIEQLLDSFAAHGCEARIKRLDANGDTLERDRWASTLQDLADREARCNPELRRIVLTEFTPA